MREAVKRYVRHTETIHRLRRLEEELADKLHENGFANNETYAFDVGTPSRNVKKSEPTAATGLLNVPRPNVNNPHLPYPMLRPSYIPHKPIIQAADHPPLPVQYKFEFSDRKPKDAPFELNSPNESEKSEDKLDVKLNDLKVEGQIDLPCDDNEMIIEKAKNIKEFKTKTSKGIHSKAEKEFDALIAVPEILKPTSQKSAEAKALRDQKNRELLQEMIVSNS